MEVCNKKYLAPGYGQILVDGRGWRDYTEKDRKLPSVRMAHKEFV